MAIQDVRIRFDDEFDEVIDDLRKLPYFPDLASLAIFSASLGYAKQVKHERTKGNREVRAQVLLNSPSGALITDALGVVELIEAADPLSAENLEARMRVFQDYANGGLMLMSQMREQGQLLASAVPKLIVDQIKKSGEK